MEIKYDYNKILLFTCFYSVSHLPSIDVVSCHSNTKKIKILCCYLPNNNRNQLYFVKIGMIYLEFKGKVRETISGR